MNALPALTTIATAPSAPSSPAARRRSPRPVVLPRRSAGRVLLRAARAVDPVRPVPRTDAA